MNNNYQQQPVYAPGQIFKRDVLERRNISINKAATMLCTSVQDLSLILEGKSSLPRAVAEKMYRVLDVDKHLLGELQKPVHKKVFELPKQVVSYTEKFGAKDIRHRMLVSKRKGTEIINNWKLDTNFCKLELPFIDSPEIRSIISNELTELHITKYSITKSENAGFVLSISMNDYEKFMEPAILREYRAEKIRSWYEYFLEDNTLNYLVNKANLNIINNIIYYKIYQQDGTMQQMTCKDTFFNRLGVSWIQAHDRYTSHSIIDS